MIVTKGKQKQTHFHVDKYEHGKRWQVASIA